MKRPLTGNESADHLKSVEDITRFLETAMEDGGYDPEYIASVIAVAKKARARLAKHRGEEDPNAWIILELLLGTLEGDDSAAREHLAAGFPIYYGHDDTPEGLQIKQWPDGRRELVRFEEAGDEVIRVL